MILLKVSPYHYSPLHKSAKINPYENQSQKIALFIEKMYQDLEVWNPYYRMREGGAQVTMIAPKKNQVYHGKNGYPAQAQISIKNGKPKDMMP